MGFLVSAWGCVCVCVCGGSRVCVCLCDEVCLRVCLCSLGLLRTCTLGEFPVRQDLRITWFIIVRVCSACLARGQEGENTLCVRGWIRERVLVGFENVF